MSSFQRPMANCSLDMLSSFHSPLPFCVSTKYIDTAYLICFKSLQSNNYYFVDRQVCSFVILFKNSQLRSLCINICQFIQSVTT